MTFARRFPFVALLLFVPALALARAGGGGGSGGGGGGIVGLVLLPFFIVYSIVVSAVAARKHRQSAGLLRRLEAADASWDLERIGARVEKVFFVVQRAWMERNQDIAREFVSDRLYEKHKLQTDAMLREHRTNMLANINLRQATVVGVKDYRDDTLDRLWVRIEGSMIDWTVSDDTKVVLSGNPSQPESFEELWVFVRGPKGWVLDEINQDAGLLNLQNLPVSSETADTGTLPTV